MSLGVNYANVTITGTTLENVGTEFNFRNLAVDVTFNASGAITGLTTASEATTPSLCWAANGNDTLTGTIFADVLDGNNLNVNNADNDILTGDGDGDDQLLGRAGNDTTLNGGNNNDNVDGGAGNDTVTGGSGADTLSGGWNGHTELRRSASAAVTVNPRHQHGVRVRGDGDTISGFENVVGSAFADTLTGDANANTLTGGDGNDVLEGGAGGDTLAGGNGVDTASYANSESAITVNLTRSPPPAETRRANVLSSIENVIGSAYADTITGNNNGNVLTGNNGDDVIIGSGGDDTLVGGEGADSLIVAAVSTPSVIQAPPPV